MWWGRRERRARTFYIPHLAAGRLWWRGREESTGTSKPNVEVKEVCQIAGAQPETSSTVEGRRMNVYYWRTWYKAVCGGKGGSEGHVLRDTTSRGLRGRRDTGGQFFPRTMSRKSPRFDGPRSSAAAHRAARGRGVRFTLHCATLRCEDGRGHELSVRGAPKQGAAPAGAHARMHAVRGQTR